MERVICQFLADGLTDAVDSNDDACTMIALSEALEARDSFR